MFPHSAITKSLLRWGQAQTARRMVRPTSWLQELNGFPTAEDFIEKNEKNFPEISGALTCRKTETGNEIYFVDININNSNRYILYSHDNNHDLDDSFILHRVCEHVGCNGISYDYSGYGVSGGERFFNQDLELDDEIYEESVFMSDIKCIHDYLIKERHVDPKNIILYGNQIGTYPTLKYGLEMYLEKKVTFGGIILESIIPSALHIVDPHLFDTNTMEPRETWVDLVNVFDNFALIKHICNEQIEFPVPILFIHDKGDLVCDFKYAEQLYTKLVESNGRYMNIMEPLWLDDVVSDQHVSLVHVPIKDKPGYFSSVPRKVFYDSLAKMMQT